MNPSHDGLTRSQRRRNRNQRTQQRLNSNPSQTSQQSIPINMNQDIKIIPLTKNNYQRWRSMIKKAAILHDAEQHLESIVSIPDNATPQQKRDHFKSQTRAPMLIEQSLSTDAATLLGADHQDLTPCELMKKIDTKITASTEAHRRHLAREAENLKCDDRMTIPEHMLKRMEIRNKMKIAGCEGMSDETKTVQCMLEGIEHHPDYHQYIAPLTLTPPTTIESTEMKLLTAHDKIARAQAYAATATRNNSFIQWPTRGNQHPPRGQRGAGRRGRGRGNQPWQGCRRRQYGNNPRPQGYVGKWRTHHGATTRSNEECYALSANRANSAQEIEMTEQPINEPSSPYILDSGAYPTHINKPLRTITNRTSLQTTTANGRTAPITHSGPMRIDHKGPCPLHMPRALVAPTFRNNLLSVHQMRNQHDMLFQQRKAHLLPKHRPPPKKLIQGTATAINGTCALETHQSTVNSAQLPNPSMLPLPTFLKQTAKTTKAKPKTNNHQNAKLTTTTTQHMTKALKTQPHKRQQRNQASPRHATTHK